MKPLKECSNEELNEILVKMGLNPGVKNDEDRVVAISFISQLNPTCGS